MSHNHNKNKMRSHPLRVEQTVHDKVVELSKKEKRSTNSQFAILIDEALEARKNK